VVIEFEESCYCKVVVGMWTTLIILRIGELHPTHPSIRVGFTPWVRLAFNLF